MVGKHRAGNQNLDRELMLTAAAAPALTALQGKPGPKTAPEGAAYFSKLGSSDRGETRIGYALDVEMLFGEMRDAMILLREDAEDLVRRTRQAMERATMPPQPPASSPGVPFES